MVWTHNRNFPHCRLRNTGMRSRTPGTNMKGSFSVCRMIQIFHSFDLVLPAFAAFCKMYLESESFSVDIRVFQRKNVLHQWNYRAVCTEEL